MHSSAVDTRMPGVTSASPRRFAETLVVPHRNEVAVDGVVLTSARCDLERAQQRREPPGALPVPALGNAIEQARAIRIAAARGIDERARRHRRNLDHASIGVYARSLAAESHD